MTQACFDFRPRRKWPATSGRSTVLRSADHWIHMRRRLWLVSRALVLASITVVVARCGNRSAPFEAPEAGLCKRNTDCPSVRCTPLVFADASMKCVPSQTCDNGTCIPTCATDSDCTSTPSAPRCLQNTCVQCLVNSDCRHASNGDVPTPACAANNVCIQCNGDSDCPAASPHCSNETCFVCLTDADCDGGTCGPFMNVCK